MGLELLALLGSGGMVLAAIVIVILLVNHFRNSGSWINRKLVMRGYYVAFEPIADGAPVGGYSLSETMTGLMQGDAKFAIVIGRPAGLLNFLREGMGLSRRLEFVLGKSQVAVRYASFTTQSLQCAKLKGLNTIQVDRQKPNPLGLILPFLLIAGIFGMVAALAESEGLATIGVLLAALICITYYLTQRVTRFTFSESGQPEVRFEVYPPILERLAGREAPELPLEDADRVVQIFRVLKDR